MLITNVQRFSTNDGPGIRTTVFLKGCPLICTWCHNTENCSPHQEYYFFKNKCTRCGHCAEICPENVISIKPENGGYPVRERNKCKECLKCVNECPSEALELVGREWTIEEVMKEVEADKLFYDNSGGGVTISGGEPLLWPEFTSEILKRCKMEWIHTCIDTSGYASWNNFEKILIYADMVLYDIKCIDSKKHIEVTGVSNEIIIENLYKINEKFYKNTRIRIRLPIIPGINDNQNFFESVGKLALELKETVEGIDILPFHNWAQNKYEQLDRKYAFTEVDSLNPEELMHYVNILTNLGLEVTIGG